MSGWLLFLILVCIVIGDFSDNSDKRKWRKEVLNELRDIKMWLRDIRKNQK